MLQKKKKLILMLVLFVLLWEVGIHTYVSRFIGRLSIPLDNTDYNTRAPKATQVLHDRKLPQVLDNVTCNLCQLQKPVFIKEHRPFIALASYMGSGNSWTRELLEIITGVYTGSIYIDSAGQFPGSRRCPLRGGVYIVKTHEIDNRTNHIDCTRMHAPTINYNKAMFILRNPYDTMLSLFNLVYGGKIRFAPRILFNSSRWYTSVAQQCRSWTNMAVYWLTEFKKPLYIIVYEQLKSNTATELSKIGTFLHLNSTYLDYSCAKHCLKPKYYRGGGERPEWMNTHTLFKGVLTEMVNRAINYVIGKVETQGQLDYILPVLKSYVR